MCERESIGEHRVVDTLVGHGRQVYLTERSDDDGTYVVALFDVSPDAAMQLQRCMTSCRELDDPHLANLVEMFEHEGRRAVVFEVMRGVSLLHALAHIDGEGGHLSDAAVFAVGLGMCRGLDAAHSAKNEDGKVRPLVHAQLGLHQIFLSFDGSVKVLGIGLGPIFALAPDPATMLPSAAQHAAPEARTGDRLTVRANNFSAASILWSMLTRCAPPDNGVHPPIAMVRPDIERGIASAIDKALEPALIKRTGTCGQLARAIEDSGLASQQALADEIAVVASDNFAAHSMALEALPPTSDVPSEAPSSEDSTMQFEWPSIALRETVDSDMPESDVPTRVVGAESLLSAARAAADRASAKDQPPPPQPSAPPDAPPVTAALPRPPELLRTMALDEVTETKVSPGMMLPIQDDMSLTGELPSTEPEPDQEPLPMTVQDTSLAVAPAAEPLPAPPTARVPAHFNGAVQSMPLPATQSQPDFPLPPTDDKRDYSRARLRWASMSALLATATFVVGLFIGSRALSDPPPPPAASSKPTTSAVPTPATAAPTPDPLTTEQPPAASASAEPAADEPVPDDVAVLVITTGQQDPHVYIDGKHIGPLEGEIRAPCGVHNVRLGDHPLNKWLSKSRSFDLTCGQRHHLTLESWFAGKTPGTD